MKNIQLTLMPDVRCKGFQKEEKRVGWEGLFNLFVSALWGCWWGGGGFI